MSLFVAAWPVDPDVPEAAIRKAAHSDLRRMADFAGVRLTRTPAWQVVDPATADGRPADPILVAYSPAIRVDAELEPLSPRESGDTVDVPDEVALPAVRQLVDQGLDVEQIIAHCHLPRRRVHRLVDLASQKPPVTTRGGKGR